MTGGGAFGVERGGDGAGCSRSPSRCPGLYIQDLVWGGRAGGPEALLGWQCLLSAASSHQRPAGERLVLGAEPHCPLLCGHLCGCGVRADARRHRPEAGAVSGPSPWMPPPGHLPTVGHQAGGTAASCLRNWLPLILSLGKYLFMWPLDASVSFLSCLSIAYVSPVIFVVLLLICKSSLVFKKIRPVIIGLAVTFLLVVFFV